MMTDEFISELLTALKSSQISESISPEIRKVLYKPRRLKQGSDKTLEDALVEAMAMGKNVVVAGSAGGGKTMLIEHVVARVTEMNKSISILIVPDLTAVDGDRGIFLEDQISKHDQFIIAANEGILRSPGVREVLKGVWETLRALQNGEINSNYCDTVVIDIAGFDPISSSLASILSDKSIHDAVRKHEKTCPENLPDYPCPRLEALELLDYEMSETIVQIVSTAFGSGEVTYRELWNFVVDILLGGNCEGSVPESTWFWRIFKGDSSIAAKLYSQHRPNILSMPDITAHLYRGNWQKIDSMYFGENYRMVDPGSAPIHHAEDETRSDLLLWLKLQLAFVSRANGHKNPIFLGEIAGDLENQILRDARIDVLVQSLNGYFKREKAADNQASLNLWIDMATQKRTKRSKSLMGLGVFPRRDLKIIRSQVVGNIEAISVEGTRAYLKSKNNLYTSLELSANLFEALVQGRPISTERRKYDDVDFAIRKFYLEIYSTNVVEDAETLKILSTNSNGQTHEATFRVPSNAKIERIS
jgi:hypothetical protein